MEVWIDEKRPDVMSTANVVLALVIHVVCFLGFFLGGFAFSLGFSSFCLTFCLLSFGLCLRSGLSLLGLGLGCCFLLFFRSRSRFLNLLFCRSRIFVGLVSHNRLVDTSFGVRVALHTDGLTRTFAGASIS